MKHPDFWRLWLVGLLLLTGRWIDMLVFAVFTYQSTGSAFLVSLVTMLRMLPMGLFGTFLGAVADRVERRVFLIAIVSTSFATATALAILAYLEHLTVWHLAVGSFINGLGWAADGPVRRMMIGDTVGPGRVGSAMSIDVGSNFLSRVIGPTIGGVILAAVGIQGTFAFCMGLYAVAFTCALGVRYRNDTTRKAADVFLAGIVDGVKLAWNDERLRATLIVTLILNLFGWPFTSMIAVIGQDNLHLGAQGIGLLTSVDGFGACCGAIAIGLFARPTQYGRIYAGGTVLYLVMMALFAITTHPLPAAATLWVLGLGGAGFAVMQTTLIYLMVQPEMRGRMLGVLATCIGVGPIGYLHLGLLAEMISAKWATVVFGVEGLLIMALTYRHWRVLIAGPDDRP